MVAAGCARPLGGDASGLYHDAVSFYDEVLRELMVALGAALFLGNLVALARRPADRRRAGAARARVTRPGSPVQSQAHPARVRRDELTQAPPGRTVLYLLIGLVIMIWGIATLVSG